MADLVSLGPEMTDKAICDIRIILDDEDAGARTRLDLEQGRYGHGPVGQNEGRRRGIQLPVDRSDSKLALSDRKHNAVCSVDIVYIVIRNPESNKRQASQRVSEGTLKPPEASPALNAASSLTDSCRRLVHKKPGGGYEPTLSLAALTGS